MIKKTFIFLATCGALFLTALNAYSQQSPDKAYFAAPGIIPHGVEDEDRSACLHCHENGMIVKGVKAPITPHPDLLNCRQCHLNLQNLPPFKPNSYTGLKMSDKTFRQNQYAPPLIPHRTFMYTKCLVCHENRAMAGKVSQTSHPERLNCKQCHLDHIDKSIFMEAGDVVLGN